MHKLIIRAYAPPVTACGIRLAATYPQSNRALPIDREVLIEASVVDGDVTCPDCRENVAPPKDEEGT